MSPAYMQEACDRGPGVPSQGLDVHKVSLPVVGRKADAGGR